MNIKLGDYITIMNDENGIIMIGIIKEVISENYFDFYVTWDVSSDRVVNVKVRNHKGRVLLSNDAEKKMLLDKLIQHSKNYVKLL